MIARYTTKKILLSLILASSYLGASQDSTKNETDFLAEFKKLKSDFEKERLENAEKTKQLNEQIQALLKKQNPLNLGNVQQQETKVRLENMQQNVPENIEERPKMGLRQRCTHFTKAIGYSAAAGAIIYEGTKEALVFSAFPLGLMATLAMDGPNSNPDTVMTCVGVGMCCCATAGCCAATYMVLPWLKKGKNHFIEACKKNQ